MISGWTTKEALKVAIYKEKQADNCLNNIDNLFGAYPLSKRGMKILSNISGAELYTHEIPEFVNYALKRLNKK